jgi:hypothetical protein
VVYNLFECLASVLLWWKADFSGRDPARLAGPHPVLPARRALFEKGGHVPASAVPASEKPR